MLPRLAAALLVTAVAAPAVAAPGDDDIKNAIRRGQYYLASLYKHGVRGGGGGFGDSLNGAALLSLTGGNGCGSAALSGLALLESGLPATDPALVNLERALRSAAFSTKATYEVSLLILFFDRLGRKEDRPMIQFLTVRLLGGQLRDGSWTYSCEGLQLDAANERLIAGELTKEARVATPPAKTDPKETRPRKDLDPPPPAKKDPPKPEPKKDEPEGLHPRVKQLLDMVIRAGLGGWVTAGDHSNTQFATVGLWVGRRHRVPVDAALKLLDKHYRECQAADGGWTYSTAGGPSTPSMTCAGLMAVAMGHGAKLATEGARGEPRPGADLEALMADKVVANGLKYVSQYLAAAADPRGGAAPDAGDAFSSNRLSSNLYFMWSLERVGMVYGLKEFGKVDWYAWGAKELVRTQQRDGSWQDNGQTAQVTVENATAFALLFLSRANAAEDLSTRLTGKVGDPGKARLQGGSTPELVGKESMTSSPKKPEGATTVKTPPTPTAQTDPAAEMADALVKAKPAERAVLLAKYRDTKGTEYTDALVRALAKLEGAALAETRDALAQRLTRMTPAFLVTYMESQNRELRRAAALACAAKGKDRVKEFGEALVKLIGDSDPLVVQAARASLKELSGADHGPNTAATPADQRRALTGWQKWWDGQK
jgi:hypothetical protein